MDTAVMHLQLLIEQWRSAFECMIMEVTEIKKTESGAATTAEIAAGDANPRRESPTTADTPVEDAKKPRRESPTGDTGCWAINTQWCLSLDSLDEAVPVRFVVRGHPSGSFAVSFRVGDDDAVYRVGESHPTDEGIDRLLHQAMAHMFHHQGSMDVGAGYDGYDSAGDGGSDAEVAGRPPTPEVDVEMMEACRELFVLVCAGRTAEAGAGDAVEDVAMMGLEEFEAFYITMLMARGVSEGDAMEQARKKRFGKPKSESLFESLDCKNEHRVSFLEFWNHAHTQNVLLPLDASERDFALEFLRATAVAKRRSSQ